MKKINRLVEIIFFTLITFHLNDAIAGKPNFSQDPSSERLSHTHPHTLENLKQDLEKAKVDFHDVGKVCEEIAKMDYEDYYPSEEYEIRSGVVYGAWSPSPIQQGELDLVVLRKSDRRVVEVAEVKCWKNLASAYKKARKQRDRLFWSLRSSPDLSFYIPKVDFSLFSTNFKGSLGTKDLIYTLISQKGGEQAGFDYTLNYSLDELKSLSKELAKERSASKEKSCDH